MNDTQVIKYPLGYIGPIAEEVKMVESIAIINDIDRIQKLNRDDD